MVKLLTTGMLAISLSLCTPVFGQAEELNTLIEENYTYKYATSANVNIREEPNTDSTILGKTLLNTEFQVVEDVDGWSKITTEAGYAYIKSEYLSDTETEYIPLGRFKVSHYCIEPHKHICGTGTGLTKLGTKVHPGSLSVDPRIIPLGSTVMINGVEYIAEDTGGAIKGNKVDMAVATHQEALQRGVYYAEIYLKVK
jgi:3D (Asp-Asp-Asp) domain-containing protein